MVFEPFFFTENRDRQTLEEPEYSWNLMQNNTNERVKAVEVNIPIWHNMSYIMTSCGSPHQVKTR